MANGSRERLDVTLPAESATKLRHLAERMHVEPETLARWLLTRAVDDADADPDAARIVSLLDDITGARKRIEAGVADVRAGRTVPFGRP